MFKLPLRKPLSAAFTRTLIRKQHSQRNSAYEYTSQRPGSTPKEDLAVFKQSQRLQGMLMGTLALVTLLGGFQLYTHRNWVKAKIYGDNFDNESFDEMYNGLREKKKLKNENLIDNAQAVTNPNGSNVPGIYICGNNKYGLVSNDSQFDIVPLFKRLDMFDNFIVKDISISEKSGALINEKGDLYQWGKGFNGDSKKPTLKGFNLEKVQISNGVIYALNSKGEVYYIPESSSIQKEKLNSVNGWFGKSRVSYFKLFTPTPIKDISSGLEHLMLLDKYGQVSTCATGLPDTVLGKSHGQFGLPEFSQFDEPPRPNEVHSVVLLNKFKNDSGLIEKRKITSIGAGNYTSLVCDDLGAIWAWGWNKYGTIGKSLNFDTEYVSYPVRIEGLNSHFKRSEIAKCIDLRVGGDTVFATVTVSDIYKMFEERIKKGSETHLAEVDNGHTLKYFSWGHGLKGSLGLSPQMFIHLTSEPKEMKSLTSMQDYNESTKKMEPIKVREWAIGYRHGAIALENGDVMTWGDGTAGQLGDGKRNRRGAPSYIPKLLEPNGEICEKWNNRMQLQKTGKWKQELAAGWDTTAIVYKRI